MSWPAFCVMFTAFLSLAVVAVGFSMLGQKKDDSRAAAEQLSRSVKVATVLTSKPAGSLDAATLEDLAAVVASPAEVTWTERIADGARTAQVIVEPYCTPVTWSAEAGSEPVVGKTVKGKSCA